MTYACSFSTLLELESTWGNWTAHAQVVDDLLQGLVADEEGAALGRPPDDSHPIAK